MCRLSNCPVNVGCPRSVSVSTCFIIDTAMLQCCMLRATCYVLHAQSCETWTSARTYTIAHTSIPDLAPNKTLHILQQTHAHTPNNKQTNKRTNELNTKSNPNPNPKLRHAVKIVHCKWSRNRMAFMLQPCNIFIVLISYMSFSRSVLSVQCFNFYLHMQWGSWQV